MKAEAILFYFGQRGIAHGINVDFVMGPFLIERNLNDEQLRRSNRISIRLMYLRAKLGLFRVSLVVPGT